MKELEKLLKEIEKIEINYNYEESYTNLYNTIIDYQNNTQDFDFEYLFENFINYDLAEELTKYELEKNGLIRLYYFLNNVNLNNDFFMINGYGNLKDISKEDIDFLKEKIIDEIKRKLKK